MHVITGGAYNGKAAWVRQAYKLNTKKHTWISAYRKDPVPVNLQLYDTSLIVLEGIEQWIWQLVAEKNREYTRHDGRELMKSWHNWEQKQSGRKLVVIGNDISKGIVPLKQEERVWRDAAGWFYQDLVKECERFDVIWYGINQPLKGRKQR